MMKRIGTAFRCHGVLACLFMAMTLCGLALGEAQARSTRSYDRHFNAAMRLYQAGRFTEAIPEFQAAYDIEPLPNLLFNIGQAHLKLGHAREALSFYDRYRRAPRKPDATQEALLLECIQRARSMLDDGDPPPERAPAERPPQEVAPPAKEPAPPAVVAEKVDPKAKVVVQPIPGVVTQPPRWSSARRATAWTLGGLLVATLTTSIALTALDGQSAGVQVMDELQYSTRYNFAPFYGAGYAAAGLLAGGLALTLTLPNRHTQK